MAVESQRSLVPPECILRHESDDEESFVVLGHSLSPDSRDGELNIDLTDEIEIGAVQSSVSLSTTSIEHMHNSTPNNYVISDFVQTLPIRTRDVSLNTTASSTFLSSDEVQEKVDMLVKENWKLKDTLNQNNLAMKKQYDTLVLWQNDVMSVHNSHKEKFAETKSFIDKLKLEKAGLLQKLDQKEEIITLLKNEIKELHSVKTNVNQISQSSFDNLIEFELQTAKKKILDLEQLLTDERSKLAKEICTQEALKKTIADVQAELTQCKLNNEQLENNLIAKKRESDAIQKIFVEEIKTLKDKIMTESTVKQNHEKVEEQLMAAQMHITELQLSNEKDKETINANEEKIQELSLKIEEVTADNQALQLQVNVYSKDFEAERKAKQTLKAEKENIAIDLRTMQRRNQELHEQVERLKNADYVYVGREEQAAAATAPSEQEEFICFKCSRKYHNFPAYETHVYRCIEIDNLF